MNASRTYRPSGFTIVELLIVIVVIAILAAISVAAYSGVQNRAYDSSVQNDLRNIASQLEAYNAIQGVYPLSETDLHSSDLNIKVSKSAYGVFMPAPENHNLLYCHPSSFNSTTYALIAVSKSGTWFQYGGSGAGSYEGPHTATSTAVCSAAGAPIPASNDANRTWFYRVGAWRGYVTP